MTTGKRIGPPLTAPDAEAREGRVIIRCSPGELAVLDAATALDGAKRASWVRVHALLAARRRINAEIAED